MPQVPTYQKETKLNGSPLPYQHYNLNEYMFGGAQANAMVNAGNNLGNLAKVALKINDQIEDAKMLELSNKINEWEETNLYNKDTGYFAKVGKDAVGQSPEIMKNFDDFIGEYKSKNRVSRFNQARMDDMISKQKTRISRGVNAHDLGQAQVWAKNEGEVGLANAMKNMVKSRNNPEDMKVQIENIKSIVAWQGQIQNLDEPTIKKMEEDAVSQAHCSVLDTYIQDGDLKAGEYFEEHKDEIDPKVHSRYIGAIKNEQMKYQARDMANEIIMSSGSEQEAITRAEAIKDINMSDQVVSRVKRHYSEQEHFKDLAERDSLNNFYNKAIKVQQNGGTLSYDDIPDNLDPQTKLSLMNYVNKNGQPETDDGIWETLYDKSVNDAQGFAKEDLNKYRGFLSESEYKSFLKKQQDIKAGGYYTVIKDDDKKIDAALEAIGLKKGKKEAVGFSEIKSMVREFEARKGRKINDNELNNIINSLGYKGSNGVQTYKLIEKGMAERTGFIRDVMNDFAYYQSKHNGELPPDSEKWKIINNRVNNKIQEQNNQVISLQGQMKNNTQLMNKLAMVTPKKNEQKVLTYFADTQIPALGKQLGLRLTVTSRYRPQKGSHHSEGRAADVSMSEHNAQNRIRIYEKMLALPTVQTIGTSDPLILSTFSGYLKSQNGKPPKLKDERKYDKQHGTNHKNHAHVTLINANPPRPTGNRVASNGTYRF